ncbi:hypothetical protein CJ030_MR7G009258 [Morella rubra]|uniref:Uncharacterized protein n=1 Tax=Morella rubra TaxID=262757 RepID=A0A6A1V056_9ROSI|nr:hypothetical protein CJ030_MR7G009258 [Morella rubra]
MSEFSGPLPHFHPGGSVNWPISGRAFLGPSSSLGIDKGKQVAKSSPGVAMDTFELEEHITLAVLKARHSKIALCKRQCPRKYVLVDHEVEDSTKESLQIANCKLLLWLWLWLWLACESVIADWKIGETVYNPRASIGDIVKSWFIKDLGEKWRNYKCSLKQEIFDEAFTPQYVKNNAPTDVNLEQFCKLVDFWYSDAGRRRSQAGNKVDHSRRRSTLQDQRALHVMLTNWKKRNKFQLIEQSYIKLSISRSDGSPINPDVAEKIRRMEEIGLNDSGSSQTSSQFRVDGSIGWSPSDRYAQVIGPERHGRIRGVGLGPTPSSHPANTNIRSRATSKPKCCNNNHQVSPTIHNLISCKSENECDNADDAESAGADGAVKVLKVEGLNL